MTARVLVHRLGSLGDTVVALPCFHRIRAAFPGSEVRVLTNAPVNDRAPPLFAVLEGSGLVDGFFAYPVSLRDWRALWGLARRIRAWRADTVIYLVPRKRKREVLRDAAFLLACGVTRFIGLPLKRELMNGRQLDGGYFEREAARLARCLSALGPIDLTDRANWNLHLTAEEQSYARNLVAERVGAQPFIALCIGTKLASKDWGIANWRALVEGLLDVYPHMILFVGAQPDWELSESLLRLGSRRCVNLCGTLKVRESAAVIALASLFIGNDSGPMHLANAVGVPLIAIFANFAPPGMWFPMGEQARVFYPYEQDAVIGATTPGEIMAAVKDFLPLDTGQRDRADRA